MHFPHQVELSKLISTIRQQNQVTHRTLCVHLFLLTLHLITSVCLGTRCFKSPSGFVSLNSTSSSKYFFLFFCVCFILQSNPFAFITVFMRFPTEQIKSGTRCPCMSLVIQIPGCSGYLSVKCLCQLCVCPTARGSSPRGHRDYQHLRRCFPKPADLINLN